MKVIPLDTPCPIELDRSLSDGSRRDWHCGHCEKTVHVLSSMTEDQAVDFLAEREGEQLCVTYLARPDGTIHFKPPQATPRVEAPAPPVPFVPVSALRRRTSAAAATTTGAAAAGLAAALAACTPLDRGGDEETPAAAVSTEKPAEDATISRGTKFSVTKHVEDARDKKEADEIAARNAEALKDEPCDDPKPETEIDPAELVPMPGGISVPHVAPPPPPPTTASTGTGKIAPMRRGGIKVKRP